MPNNNQDNEYTGGNYPRVPYYKDNYARRLSRMTHEARLLAKAIRRSLDVPKKKYNNFGQDHYVISNKDVTPQQSVNHLPKEWR